MVQTAGLGAPLEMLGRDGTPEPSAAYKDSDPTLSFPSPPPTASSTAFSFVTTPQPIQVDAPCPAPPEPSFASVQAAMAAQNSSHSQNLTGHCIDNGRLEFISILGLGAYGVVYLARDITVPPTREPTSAARPELGHQPLYAVKCLNKVGLDHRQRSFQCREILLHGLASHHSNVVTLYNVIEEPTCIYVVLEFCEEGDLFGMITERQRYLGDDALIKDVFLQILDAVEHCHQAGIYHRDLKPENILCLDDGKKVVLADFGLATSDRTSGDFGCGSTFYMSPECQGGLFQRLGSYSTPHNDVWSLGVILVNLTCGRNPWKQACPSDETFRAYLANPDFLRAILPISGHTNRILKRIFALNPQARITMQELRAEIVAIKTFVMTEEELRTATRATKEAARAFANKKVEEEEEVDDQLDDIEIEVVESSMTDSTFGDDESLTSPPISPFQSLAPPTTNVIPATPVQQSTQSPLTPSPTPRRKFLNRPPNLVPPPVTSCYSDESCESLSPCGSNNSSDTLASDDSNQGQSTYSTPPQYSRSVFADSGARHQLPPSPPVPSLRRPKVTRQARRRKESSSGDSSSSSSGNGSQPPTPTGPAPFRAGQPARSMSSKASYVAFYPLFSDWADNASSQHTDFAVPVYPESVRFQ